MILASIHNTILQSQGLGSLEKWTHTHTHTHTQIRACQKDPGANENSTQWPELEHLEQKM